MQAAIGLAQLDKLPAIISKKQKIHDKYQESLKSLNDVLRPIYLDPRTTPVHWFTSFLTSRKKELQSYLKSKNIQTRDFFYPLNLQPCYECLASKPFKISEKSYYEGISLPSSYKLKTEQQEYIIDSIKEFFKDDTVS